MKNFSFVKVFKPLVITTVSIIIIGLVYGIAFGGFNWGLDFTGGNIITLEMGTAEFVESDITGVLESLGISEAQVAIVGDGAEKTGATIRIKPLDSATQEKLNEELVSLLKADFANVSLVSSDSVGGTIGSETTLNALTSVGVACVLILIYIAFRFEFLFGLSSILAILHDVGFMFAFVAFARLPLNSSFVAAILTIVGYSINATIVVFDRVRENLKRYPGKEKTREEIVDISIRGTIYRSINTSITTLLTITALYILGVDSIREFALPIIVGIIAGAYSSICIAGPLWNLMHKHLDGKKLFAGKGKGRATRAKSKKAKARA